MSNEAATEFETFDLTLLPVRPLIEVSKAFKEGVDKYGRHNYINAAGDKVWQLERLNHAMKHLMWAVHNFDRSDDEIGEGEDDFAKAVCNILMVMETREIELFTNKLNKGDEELQLPLLFTETSEEPTVVLASFQFINLDSQLREYIRACNKDYTPNEGKWFYYTNSRNVVFVRHPEMEKFYRKNEWHIKDQTLRAIVEITE